MQKPGTAERLQANLSEILDNTRQMLALLAAERRALSDNDIEALDEAGVEKTRLAASLERLDQVRTDLVCQHQAEHQRPPTMDALVDESDGLKGLWHAVRDAVSDCDRLNQINGAALRVRRESVSRALSLLHGSASEHAPLYDQAGQAPASVAPCSGTSLGRV